MRILFQMAYPGYLRIYGSTVRELAERGNTVLLSYDSEKRREPAAVAIEELPGVKVVKRVPDRRGRSAGLVRDLRLALDYAQYLDPRFADAQPVRRRMDKYLPRLLRFLVSAPVLSAWQSRMLLGALRALEHAVPSSPRVEAFLGSLAPDCVIVTPLIARGAGGVRQTDTVLGARALGIPVACAVTSWDHLTSKGMIKGNPDRVLLWNDAQRAEAIELHGVDPDRTEITGAQLFDQWFARRPSATRENFCERVGLTDDRPLLLYVGSSANIAPAEREIEFVRRWVAALRSSGSEALREAAVLVRPHPGNVEAWAAVDVSDLSGVAVSPRVRPSIPMTSEDEAHYFDSLHFSAAVVGINTSAMIEAAIVGRPVHTVRSEGFEDTQEGTKHFHLLVPPEGGAVRVAAGMKQHLEQLDEALAAPYEMRERAERFVRAFVRPHGLDRPATPIVADAIERLAREGEFVHPLRARGRYRLVGKRYRALGSFVARSFWRPAKRDAEKVSTVYEAHYDLDNETYARTRDKRRDMFLLGRRPVYTDGWFTIRFHSDLLVETLDRLAARSVLEVGSGRGTNLALLAARRPDLQLTGLELTRRGVENSRALVTDLPQQHLRAAGLRSLDEPARQALARVEFVQGSALEMPFDDDAFDVSFTCLVLEQLWHEYEPVLAEMRRVTRHYCFFLEPFAEANGPVGRAYLRSLDYFRARHADFTAHGLEPVSFTTNIPQKVHFRTGLLVTRVSPSPARTPARGSSRPSPSDPRDPAAA